MTAPYRELRFRLVHGDAHGKLQSGDGLDRRVENGARLIDGIDDLFAVRIIRFGIFFRGQPHSVAAVDVPEFSLAERGRNILRFFAFDVLEHEVFLAQKIAFDDAGTDVDGDVNLHGIIGDGEAFSEVFISGFLDRNHTRYPFKHDIIYMKTAELPPPLIAVSMKEHGILFQALFFFVFQRFQLAHKGFEVFELSVNGSEAHIRHIVNRFQLFHDKHTDALGRNLSCE